MTHFTELTRALSFCTDKSNAGGVQIQELFPREGGSPIVKRVAKEEFLLAGPSALGMFVTGKGISERPPLQVSRKRGHRRCTNNGYCCCCKLWMLLFKIVGVVVQKWGCCCTKLGMLYKIVVIVVQDCESRCSKLWLLLYKIVNVVVQNCGCCYCTKLWMLLLYKIVDVVVVQNCGCCCCAKLLLLLLKIVDIVVKNCGY